MKYNPEWVIPPKYKNNEIVLDKFLNSDKD